MLREIQAMIIMVSQKIEKFYMEEHYPLYLSDMVTEPPPKNKNFLMQIDDGQPFSLYKGNLEIYKEKY